jgi:acetoacetate decarboxylase
VSDLPFSIPRTRPLYGPPPYAYRGCPQLIVVFRSSGSAIRRLVPEPLEPNADDVAFLMIGSMVTDEFGTYGEAIVAIPSRIGEVTGSHVVFHYVEGDKPMAAGRELMGWPKKAGDIEWAEAGGRVTATCARDGESLIAATAELVQPAADEDLQLDPTWLNLRVIPSAGGDGRPDIAQITATTLRDITVEDARKGPASIRLGSTATDPLEMLDVHEVVGAVFCRLSFDLPGAEVVHDYLSAPAGASAAAGQPAVTRA